MDCLRLEPSCRLLLNDQRLLVPKLSRHATFKRTTTGARSKCGTSSGPGSSRCISLSGCRAKLPSMNRFPSLILALLLATVALAQNDADYAEKVKEEEGP